MASLTTVSYAERVSRAAALLTPRASEGLWDTSMPNELRDQIIDRLSDGFPSKADGVDVRPDPDNPGYLLFRVHEPFAGWATNFGMAPRETISEDRDADSALWWVQYGDLTEEQQRQQEARGFVGARQLVVDIFSNEKMVERSRRSHLERGGR